MVLTKIVQEIIRHAGRYAPVGKSLVNSEKLILNYAWKGFKHKSSIVGGIRTGLLGGAVIGSVINQNDDDELDGKIQRIIKTGPPYKTRSRRGRKYSSRYTKCYRPNRNSRRSSFSKRKRMRNRF